MTTQASSGQTNGIDVEALQQTIQSVTEDAVQGTTRLRVTSRLVDGTPELFRQLHESVEQISPNFHNLSQPVELICDLVLD